jgi:hypothetical protein
VRLGPVEIDVGFKRYYSRPVSVKGRRITVFKLHPRKYPQEKAEIPQVMGWLEAADSTSFLNGVCRQRLAAPANVHHTYPAESERYPQRVISKLADLALNPKGPLGELHAASGQPPPPRPLN